MVDEVSSENTAAAYAARALSTSRWMMLAAALVGIAVAAWCIATTNDASAFYLLAFPIVGVGPAWFISNGLFLLLIPRRATAALRPIARSEFRLRLVGFALTSIGMVGAAAFAAISLQALGILRLKDW